MQAKEEAALLPTKGKARLHFVPSLSVILIASVCPMAAEASSLRLHRGQAYDVCPYP